MKVKIELKRLCAIIVAALCLLSASTDGATLGHHSAATRLNVPTCAVGNCVSALSNCIEKKCDGLVPCKKCILDFYPHCLACYEGITTYYIQDEYDETCDPASAAQKNSCFIFCQSSSGVGVCDGTCTCKFDQPQPPLGFIRELKGHSDYVSTAVVLKNGRIASGSYDKTIKIWDPASGQVEKTMPIQDNYITALAALHDGSLASASRDKQIRVWEPTTGALKYTLDDHTERVCALAVLQNGDLASGSYDKTIKIWDTTTGKLKQTVDNHSGSVCSLTVLEDGRLVSGSSDKSVRVWNQNFVQVATMSHGGTVWGLATLNKDYVASVSNDMTMKVWKVSANFAEFDSHNVNNALFISASVSRQGNLVVGDADGHMYYVNPSDKILRNTTYAHEHAIYSMGLLPNGQLVTASGDHTLKLWQTPF